VHAHTINTRPYFSPAVILAKNRLGDEANHCVVVINVIVTSCGNLNSVKTLQGAHLSFLPDKV